MVLSWSGSYVCVKFLLRIVEEYFEVTQQKRFFVADIYLPPLLVGKKSLRSFSRKCYYTGDMCSFSTEKTHNPAISSNSTFSGKSWQQLRYWELTYRPLYRLSEVSLFYFDHSPHYFYHTGVEYKRWEPASSGDLFPGANLRLLFSTFRELFRWM